MWKKSPPWVPNKEHTQHQTPIVQNIYEFVQIFQKCYKKQANSETNDKLDTSQEN